MEKKFPPDNIYQPFYKNTVAVIGSFHSRFLDDLLRVVSVFESFGIKSVNPIGIVPLDVEAPFVRFKEDDPIKSDEQLQQAANGRIILSPLVYVHCPAGYLGEDTENEILVAIGDERPILFSAFPRPKSDSRQYLQELALDNRVKTAEEAACLLLKDQVQQFIVDTISD